MLTNFWQGKERKPNGRINIIPGFDGYAVGNNRELKRILGEFGIDYTLISDVSEVFDTPTDGSYRMFDGGTSLEAVREALHSKATIAMQKYCSEKSLEMAASVGQETASFHYPLGCRPPMSS